MNWWLMALAFVLGAVLTAVFTVRRVKREVPVYESAGAPARLVGETPKVSASGAEAATTTLPRASAPEVEAPTAVVPKVSAPEVETPTTTMPRVSAPDADTHVLGLTATAATAAAAGGVAAAKFAGSHERSDESPYGAGSFRGTAAPSGYDIKGNEDSMLYHTTDSPSYQQTIAEVWFNDEGVAERAGFTRWDRRRAAGRVAALADVPPGPHGIGSAAPGAGGSGPEGWAIKGNEDSMLFHTIESPSYARTIAEVWFFDEDTARRAGFTHWRDGRKGAAGFASTEPELPPGPHGPGSANPAEDGSGPAGWNVKGNADSMLYHSEESPSYGVTRAEVWFRDVETAEAAGFNRWDSGKSQRGLR